MTMSTWKKSPLTMCGLYLSLLVGSATAIAQTPAYEVTESRAPCNHYDELRQPFFGDTHVHSSYSFDSYISQQRNDPWDAYRYAKGEPITLPDGNGNYVIKAQIGRPIDFSVLTDHAEYFGEMSVCTNSDDKTLGYYWPIERLHVPLSFLRAINIELVGEIIYG